jgi:hypothetical protein
MHLMAQGIMSLSAERLTKQKVMVQADLFRVIILSAADTITEHLAV